MKSIKGMLVVVLALMVAMPGYAMLDDNSVNQKVDNDVSVRNCVDTSARSTSMAGANSDASVVGLQGQKSSQDNDVSIGGDKTTVLSYAQGSLTASAGTSGMNVGSPWGGASVGNTERYEKLNARTGILKTLVDTGLIEKDSANLEAYDIVAEMAEETKPVRFLGCLWRTDGVNLLNGFGLLSHRSFKDE